MDDKHFKSLIESTLVELGVYKPLGNCEICQKNQTKDSSDMPPKGWVSIKNNVDRLFGKDVVYLCSKECVFKYFNWVYSTAPKKPETEKS